MKTLNNTPFKKKNITNSGDSRGLLAFLKKILLLRSRTKKLKRNKLEQF